MSGRQYGIPNGYREGFPAQHGIPVSPIETYNDMQSNQSRGYAPTNLPPAGRSLPRRPVPSDSYRTPAPPPHHSGPTSPTRYRRQRFTPPNQDEYGRPTVGIANDYRRDSEEQALRDVDNLYGTGMRLPSPEPYSQSHYEHMSAAAPPSAMHQQTGSQSSIAPLTQHGANMLTNGLSQSRTNHTGTHVPGVAAYGYDYDDPILRGQSPYRGDGYGDAFDPRDIADDGDDGIEEAPRQRQKRYGGFDGAAIAGADTGVAAGTEAGMLKALGGSRDPSGNYGPISGDQKAKDPEKSDWLQQQNGGKKRLKWILGIVIALVVIGGVVGGVLGGIVFKHGGSSGSNSSPDVSSVHGLLDIDSSQVQAVLKNKDLHKVFPGIDYTPLNAQYPACLTTPPNQNNVTLDVAVLSQLTPAIRLYGTDCNQTQMVLTAIDKLNMNDTVKVWLGVWLENNQTTNTRQLNEMYDILDAYPSDHFAGVIVGNEVLFRKDMTETQLAGQLTTVKKNLASRGIDLPVATSDLGDDWTASLAADSDLVMSNVHPFFAGVTPTAAPGWTWSFWQTYDVILTGSGSTGSYPKNIISETGWPSQGGNDCGIDTKCPNPAEGAVAGIDELNTFMDGWVCQSLANGTIYFWFEAFDEPWKVMYNDPKTGDFWEPHWGLMDVNRNLKEGVKIPDCDGKTMDKPY